MKNTGTKILTALTIFVIAIILQSCYPMLHKVQPTNNSKGSNFAGLYNPGESLLNPTIKVFVKNDSLARIYFKVQNKELRNAIANPLNKEITLNIKYFLRKKENFQLVDSISFRRTLRIKDNELYSEDSFDIVIPEMKLYKLVTIFSNYEHRLHKRLLCDIDARIGFNADKYILKNENNRICYSNVVCDDKEYTIVTSKNVPHSFAIKHFSEDAYRPVPPYLIYSSKKNINNDTTINYITGEKIQFNRKGFYSLSSDDNRKFGIVASSNRTFPTVSTIEDMQTPLMLICNDKSYTRIDTAQNKKQAIDYYWLSLSKDENSAREQIRIFYNRVALANTYFSSDCEGWKTDRGMIYIMCGPPSTINITVNSEEWTYGNENSGTTFVFETPNEKQTDYQLIRNNTYQSIWSDVLSTWRQGKVFMVSNGNE